LCSSNSSSSEAKPLEPFFGYLINSLRLHLPVDAYSFGDGATLVPWPVLIRLHYRFDSMKFIKFFALLVLRL
jgi:hypothetical protein